MVNDSPTTLIIAVPGTQETKEMPRDEVIAAIQQGEIAPDNWVWSPSHNDWKQVAELPELHVPPAPVEAPTPSSVFMGGKVPGVTPSVPAVANVATPVAQKAAAQPHQVSIARTATVPIAVTAPVATAAAKTHFSKPMEVKNEFPIFKVLFFIIFLLVAGVLAGNYLYVDQPFTQNMAVTPYAAVPVYAHLGAFVQPGALVIHVPPTTALNADNMSTFLATLARNTPPRPFSSSTYDGVGLTSAWQSQYVFTGTDWDTLGKMTKVTAEERRRFELEHLMQVDGTPLLKVKRNEDPAEVTAAENKAWTAFISNFNPK